MGPAGGGGLKPDGKKLVILNIPFDGLIPHEEAICNGQAARYGRVD